MESIFEKDAKRLKYTIRKDVLICVAQTISDNKLTNKPKSK